MDNQLRLKDLCKIKIGLQNADFWLRRRGDSAVVGSVTSEYNSENIGIKVLRTDILNSDYLKYYLMFLQQRGYMARLATGVLKLQNITTTAVGNIKVKVS